MSKTLGAAQVPGVYRRNLGEFKIATVHDGMLNTNFNDVVGVSPRDWERAHRAAFRQMPPRLSCNTFVIERAGQLSLVDAGCGETAPAAGFQLAGLRALDIEPTDVDTILITHLHRDHAAGLTDSNGAAVFPNAELIVHADDLVFWRDPATLGRLRDSQKRDFGIASAALKAYAGKVRSIEGQQEVLPGITAIPTPGHTPGHTAWLLESANEGLIITGDVVHLPVIQFARPEAGVVYDVDSAAAALTRRRVLDMAANERWLMAGVHMDFPCFGWIEARGAGGFHYASEVWTSALV